MKNVLKGAVLVTLLSGGIFTAAANAIRPEFNTAAPLSAPAITAQSQLYVSNCARCHGANGKGNTISISQNAVQSHLKHGDVLGECPKIEEKSKDKSKK